MLLGKQGLWPSRIGIGILLLISMCALMDGVSAEEKTLPSGLPEWTKGVKELTYYNPGALEWDPAIVEKAKAFEAIYGIHVNLVPIPEAEHKPRIRRSLALKESTYDAIDYPIWGTMPDFPMRGWAVPLDDVVPPYLASKWPKGTWDACEYEGKHYMVPNIGMPWLLVYNKELLKQAGYDGPPETWDELAQIAMDLTKPGQWGLVFGVGKAAWPAIGIFAYFLGTAGGEMWNEDGSPAFNGPEGERALQFLVDLIHKYKVSPESAVTWGHGDASDIFDEGTAAMTIHITGHLMVKNLAALGDKMGAALIPVAERGITPKYYAYNGAGVFVNPYSKHVEAAKQLAVFWSSYMGNWFEAGVEGNIPIHVDVWNSPYVQKNFPFPEVTREALKYVVFPVHAGSEVTIEVFRQGVQDALAGKKTVSETLNWIVEELKKEKVIE